MNGAHDMGGDHGHGPVLTEVDEPLFHADWERRVFGMTLSAGGAGGWNLDQSRFARENTDPRHYLARSYYQTWLYGLEKLLVEHGVVTGDEILAARNGEHFEAVAEPRLRPDQVEAAMSSTNGARRPEGTPGRFKPGDRVTVTVSAPVGHTRKPRYVRGRTGVVDRDHGFFVFPDAHAHGEGPAPQPVYAVRFETSELWGPDAEPGAVYVDLWDDYLEPA